MAQGYVTTDGIDFNEIYYRGLVQAMDMYRRVELPVLSNLAEPAGEEIFKYGISEKNGYQPLGMGARPNRKYVQEAALYPTVKKYGYGIGSDLDTLRRSSRRQINMAIDRGFAEDPENVLLQMLKVMLKDPGTSNQRGGWYNGSFSTEEVITAPPSFQQNTFLAAHTHYYQSNSSGLTLAVLTTAKGHLKHHGNGGQPIAFINNVQVQELETLAAFTANTLTRSPISDMVAVNGFTDQFRLLGIEFYATEMMPANYMLVLDSSPLAGRRPLVMFEPANMRGLNLMPGPMNDYPLVESFFERWFGFKVWNRGGGVAIQIVNSASAYVDPTFNEPGN